MSQPRAVIALRAKPKRFESSVNLTITVMRLPSPPIGTTSIWALGLVEVRKLGGGRAEKVRIFSALDTSTTGQLRSRRVDIYDPLK